MRVLPRRERFATWSDDSPAADVAWTVAILLGGQEERWLYGPQRHRIRETLTGAAHTPHGRMAIG